MCCSSHQTTAAVGSTHPCVTKPKHCSTSQPVPHDDGEVGAAACFTFWNHPVICQTDPQAALLNLSYPAQAPLGWAGLSWASLEDLERGVCGRVVAGITTFCKAKLAKRIKSPWSDWNLGRAERFLHRDDVELNIAWDRRACLPEDYERQHRPGH